MKLTFWTFFGGGRNDNREGMKKDEPGLMLFTYVLASSVCWRLQEKYLSSFHLTSSLVRL